MGIKSKVSAVAVAASVSAAVYIASGPALVVVPPPPPSPARQLAWDYTNSMNGIVFVILASNNHLATNVFQLWDMKGSDDTNKWVYLGLATNVFETWDQLNRLAITTNLKYSFQATGSFRLFKVIASNQWTGEISK